MHFKNFSRTPDVQISKIVFLSDETQNFKTFYKEFWRNSKNSNFFNIENCYFSDENRKNVVFWLSFFRVNTLLLDEYFPDFLCKKFHYPPKNTLRDFRGPGMTHTPEKLRWIFIQFLVIYYIKYEAKNVKCRSWCTLLMHGNIFFVIRYFCL